MIVLASGRLCQSSTRRRSSLYIGLIDNRGVIHLNSTYSLRTSTGKDGTGLLGIMLINCSASYIGLPIIADALLARPCSLASQLHTRYEKKQHEKYFSAHTTTLDTRKLDLDNLLPTTEGCFVNIWSTMERLRHSREYGGENAHPHTMIQIQHR